MKTSNIIIIAFATFIVSGMLILFVDAKQHKTKKDNNITFREYQLPTFSVVVAEKGSDLHLDQSDSTLIKVEYLKDKSVPKKMYKVINDTLYVYGGLRVFVKCPTISAVVGNKPFWVGVKNFSPDTITIKMNGGKFYLNSSDYIEKQRNRKFVNMLLIANNSAYIEIGKVQLNNIRVISNNSNINIYSRAKYLNIKIENHTKFFCYDDFINFTVEKDTTSHFKSDKVIR